MFARSISYTDTTVQLDDDYNLPLKTGFAHRLETRRFWRSTEPQARRLRLGQVIREEKKGKTTSILAPDVGERGAAGSYSEMTEIT